MSMQHALKKAGYEPQRRRPESPDRRGTSKLPNVYFSTDGEKRRYLQGEFVARKTIDPLARQLGMARPGLTSGQLRRFFNHCRQIEHRLQTERESWEQVSASFQALSSHAQYARSTGKIPNEFRIFIDDNVQRVVENRNPCEAFLRGFMPHFEALVGFASAHLKRE